ncbi:MAG: hypothetical protein JJU02_05770 [Cryomorphaceae bacterium]|nr:hypothetical protein [Cryomorphaceae bacterium]
MHNFRLSIIISLALAAIVFVISLFRDEKYIVRTDFFVPLTVLEKQMEQGGVGFAGGAEIDAHIQLLKSPVLLKVIQKKFPNIEFSFSVDRTRYGAVQVEVVGGEDSVLVEIANAFVLFGDSLKQSMMRENRLQTFTFTQNLYREKEIEVNRFQIELDSLRSLPKFQNKLKSNKTEDAYTFKIETLYGTAVNELAKYHTQLRRLEMILEAPVPRAYVISAASLPAESALTPGYLLALAAFALSFLVQYAARLIFEK